MPNVQDETQAQGYTALVQWIALFRPSMLDAFLPRWAELMRRFPYPGPGSSSSGSPGLGLTPQELGITSVLTSLGKMTPEAAEKALRYFPELEKKVEDSGGLKALVRRESQEPDRERSDGRSPGREGELTIEEVEREIERLLSEIKESSRGSFHPTEIVKKLEEAVQLLGKLEGHPGQLRSYLRVAATHLEVQGEISRELLSTGWEILDRGGEKSLTRVPAFPGGPSPAETREDMEVWLYAAECWTDFNTAIREVKTLTDDLQYSVVTRFLGWLSQSQNYRSFR